MNTVHNGILIDFGDFNFYKSINIRISQIFMKTNFKIITEYDGSYFAGWQIQKGCSTVQGELEQTLSMILNQPVKVIGSGRTDAGVHALGQTANFYANTNIAPANLLKALNSIIKVPLVIRSCSIVENDFHARYSALSKEYHYFILNSEIPRAVRRDYIWHIKQALDIDTMNKCCAMIIGEHDFKSFEASGSPRSHTVRTIYSAGMELFRMEQTTSEKQTTSEIVFKIVGNGFLRFMVRNIVGTIVMAGLSRITPKYFRQILAQRDRTFAGITAPAKGLFLMRVNY